MEGLVIASRTLKTNPPFSVRHVPFFNWRMHSLLRATSLAFCGIPFIVLSSEAARFATRPLLIIPILLMTIGILDTARCMRKRWDFYHAGVLMLLYADLLALFLVGFIFLYPYLPIIGR